MRCFSCKQGSLRVQTTTKTTRVGDYVVKDGAVQARVCDHCDQSQVTFAAGHGSELKAATVVLAEKPLDGPVLKSVRKILGLKQTELGELLGYDAESVSRWENSSREIPRAVPLAIRHLVERATHHGEESLKPGWKPDPAPCLSVDAA